MTEPIILERLIAAPPSVVYAYLTQAEKWARWQGVSATIQPSRGGIFAMCMAKGMKARGQFVELVPDQRVVFTWGWTDHPGVPPGSSIVEIDLIAEDTGTMLRLTHRGLPTHEVPVHAVGWNHYLPRLAQVAEGGNPGPDVGPPRASGP